MQGITHNRPISCGSQSEVSMVSDLWGKRFTKKVSFEFRVKEWRGDGWGEWRREGWIEVSMKRWNWLLLSAILDNVTCYAGVHCCHAVLQAFSTPWFLYANPTNHHLVFFLLEVFNNIIQYQFDGLTFNTPYFTYAVVTWNKSILKLFQPLSTSDWNNFISEHGNFTDSISKLFQKLIRADEYFPACSMLLK